MSILSWSLFGFLLGSIPFSFLIGKLFARTDIRTVGDGNPGGTNAWKAGGWRVGLLAAILDILKGFLPVYLARQNDISDWKLVPVALTPVLGHALQPFLKFRGGKALGPSGGAWVGLIGLWVFPVYASFTLPVLAIQNENAWAAFAGMFALLSYAVFLDGSLWMIVIAALNTLIIAWTHRRELRHAPHLRPWLVNLLTRRSA